jgi:predicted DNA-binding transcriptional regulator YafY
MHITYDFVKELLSHGSEVEVLAPDSLREELREKLSKALNPYKHAKQIQN